jgi:hypothetical protein
VVGMAFPAAGKVDLYDRFPQIASGNVSRPLVVVSLGLREGDRELEPAEIAGALAAQIQSVIDNRLSHANLAGQPAPPPDSPATLRPGMSPRLPAVPSAPQSSVAPSAPARSDVQRLPTLIETIQKGQPLEAAGLPSSTTNP